MINDDLNEYLECTCGRCDDGKCRCCVCWDEHPQFVTSYDEADYDDADSNEHIDYLNERD